MLVNQLVYYKALVSQAYSLPCGLQNLNGEGQTDCLELWKSLQKQTCSSLHIFLRISDFIVVATLGKVPFS